MRKLAAYVLCFAIGSTSAALGHEFWISPQDYSVATGEDIVAHIRVGQNFEGASYAYIPNNFERFELVKGDMVVPVEGRIGDRPALRYEAADEGLWIVVHETTDSRLTYDDWDKFVSFVTHKDLRGVLDAHGERGLPQTGFIESYRRFAKSLISVGNGAGADQVVGLRTEIVAQANPYVDDLSGGLPVLVLFEGQPRADAQVEVFAKDAVGDVTVTTTRTDEAGRAIIPVEPGREYLVDAVTMLPLETRKPRDEPSWYSLWAALTFEVPD